MKDCWKVEPHERPTFRKLLQDLEELRSTVIEDLIEELDEECILEI